MFFLRKVVTIFDFNQGRVGFGQPVASDEGSATYSGFPNEIGDTPFSSESSEMPSKEDVADDDGRHSTFIRQAVHMGGGTHRETYGVARHLRRPRMAALTNLVLSAVTAGLFISVLVVGLRIGMGLRFVFFFNMVMREPIRAVCCRCCCCKPT